MMERYDRQLEGRLVGTALMPGRGADQAFEGGAWKVGDGAEISMRRYASWRPLAVWPYGGMRDAVLYRPIQCGSGARNFSERHPPRLEEQVSAST